MTSTAKIKNHLLIKRMNHDFSPSIPQVVLIKNEQTPQISVKYPETVQSATFHTRRGSGQEVALTAFSAPGRCGWRSGLDSSSDDYFAPGETSGNREG